MNKGLVALFAVLGIVFLIVGVMYATQTSGSLPSFFPGYKAGDTHDKHMKHAILAIVVAVACFVFVWFQSGKKKSTSA
jgi:hypothetical protein